MLRGVLVAALVAALLVGIRLSGTDANEPAASGGDLTGSAAAELKVPTTTESTPTPADSREAQRQAALALERAKAAQQAEEARRAAAEAKAKALARKAALAAKQRAATAPFDIKIGSFNVLGSQHTAPGGDRRNFPPASVRSANAANLVAKHGVDILGTQELQDDQLAALQSRTGWPPTPEPPGARRRPTTRSSTTTTCTSSSAAASSRSRSWTQPRPQPILRLKDRDTGREFYVVNTHPSAHDGRYLVERRQGQAALVGIVNQLKESGLPVLLTGDITTARSSTAGWCRPRGWWRPTVAATAAAASRRPKPIPVDWVVGAGGITWSDYWRDTTPITNRTM